MAVLEGKVAIITGAAQGIGARLATGLAKAGASVAISDVSDGEACATAIRNGGGDAMFTQADVTDEASVETLMATVEERFGGVDVLVNNAALFGNLPPTDFEAISSDLWDQVMRVNVRGVWQAIKAVTPIMTARGGGSIINIASNRAFHGYPKMLHYDASKGAVLAMTKALAKELGDRQIRVNAVCPGLTLSESVQAKDGIDERNEAIINNRALKRAQLPEDIVGAIVFLASDLSSFVTGQSLAVDGGSTMR